MRLLDKLLTTFIYLWVGFAVLCAVADIIWIIISAPSVWSGIGAAQEKWFDPFNVMHWVAELIFVSPAIGAWFLREHLREKKAKSLGPAHTRGGEMANNPAAMDKSAALMGGIGALIVGALVLLYVGYSVKSRYDFQRRPAEIVSGLPGSRLIGSTKTLDLDSPLTLFWPEVAWTFAIPDPVLSDRFFTFRWEYGEDQATGIYLVDADCKEKKLTWYDAGEPNTAFPARDLYGEPVTDSAGDTYRRSAAQPDPPPRWMHEFCDTDWATEQKAAHTR